MDLRKEKMGKLIVPEAVEIENEKKFRDEFLKRITELKDWGKKQGYIINSFLDVNITGIKSHIGYIKITDTGEEN
jgi:hypothetical protein